MAGYMVCGKCSKMNGFCSLIKVGDESYNPAKPVNDFFLPNKKLPSLTFHPV